MTDTLLMIINGFYINMLKLLHSPTASIVLKLALVELHGQIWGLEVECHHLTAGIPKYLRHVVAGLHTATLRVDPTHLPLVVAGCLG